MGLVPGWVLRPSSSLFQPPYCVQTGIRLRSRCWPKTEPGPVSRGLPEPNCSTEPGGPLAPPPLKHGLGGGVRRDHYGPCTPQVPAQAERWPQLGI